MCLSSQNGDGGNLMTQCSTSYSAILPYLTTPIEHRLWQARSHGETLLLNIFADLIRKTLEREEFSVRGCPMLYRALILKCKSQIVCLNNMGVSVGH